MAGTSAGWIDSGNGICLLFLAHRDRCHAARQACNACNLKSVFQPYVMEAYMAPTYTLLAVLAAFTCCGSDASTVRTTKVSTTMLKMKMKPILAALGYVERMVMITTASSQGKNRDVLRLAWKMLDYMSRHTFLHSFDM